MEINRIKIEIDIDSGDESAGAADRAGVRVLYHDGRHPLHPLLLRTAMS